MEYYGVIPISVKSFLDDLTQDGGFKKESKNFCFYKRKIRQYNIYIVPDFDPSFCYFDEEFDKVFVFTYEEKINLYFLQSFYSKIKKIEINGNFKLRNILNINKFKYLESLEIHDCLIEKIFFNLPSLKKLIIQGCSLEKIKNSYLDNLEYLDLHDNNIKELNFLDSIFNNGTRINYLDVSENLIPIDQINSFKEKYKVKTIIFTDLMNEEE